MTAPVSSTPRSAWIASTTGYSRQPFTSSCSSVSRRCTRSCCSVTARTYSWKTICCAGSRTHHLGQPAEMSGGPVRPAFVANVLPQQERLQPVLGRLEIPHGIFATPAHVADRLVLKRGHVDRGQIPAAHQAGQQDGIAAIRLHPVAP